MMPRFVLIFMLATVMDATAEPLSEYRWSHRLILVFAPAEDERDVAAFRESLRDARCELEDRDILVGWFFTDAAASIGDRRVDDRQAQSIRETLRPEDAGLTVLLIGKDGAVKARYEAAPRLDELFALIDGMPMRRAEMRSRDAVCDR